MDKLQAGHATPALPPTQTNGILPRLLARTGMGRSRGGFLQQMLTLHYLLLQRMPFRLLRRFLLPQIVLLHPCLLQLLLHLVLRFCFLVQLLLQRHVAGASEAQRTVSTAGAPRAALGPAAVAAAAAAVAGPAGVAVAVNAIVVIVTAIIVHLIGAGIADLIAAAAAAGEVPQPPHLDVVLRMAPPASQDASAATEYAASVGIAAVA